MIRADGWARHNIWEHSEKLRQLYARRCAKEEPEMTCHAQAAELLAPLVAAGDTLLDVGCGSGYFYHSLKDRGLPVEYFGIDASPALLGIGRSILPAFGLSADRLLELRIEDLSACVDHVVCINVLSNLDNYHRPLERLLKAAKKSLILRESLASPASCLYVRDRFLDTGVDLSVHVNSYDPAELLAFIAAHGFEARLVTDRRCGGKPELVIGYPHHWQFVVARKVGG